MYLCDVRFCYMKHGGLDHMVNYRKQLESLKSISCDIKKTQELMVSSFVYPLQCIFQQIYVLCYILFYSVISIMLAAACVAAF